MRLLILAASTCLLLSACDKKADTTAADANMADANAMEANAAAPAATPAAFEYKETSWTYTDPKGVKVFESVDANGNYISQEQGTGKHLDHGTATMKDGKYCETSAMTKDGQLCYDVAPAAVGQTVDAVDAKGTKIAVTRVEYKPLKM